MNCPRCGKPIDEHEAGRETDACFAVVVMGHVTQRTSVGGWLILDGAAALPYCSTDIAAAWVGILKFVGDITSVEISGPCYVGEQWQVGVGLEDAEAPTAPLAIVRACLKAAAEQEGKT